MPQPKPQPSPANADTNGNGAGSDSASIVISAARSGNGNGGGARREAGVGISHAALGAILTLAIVLFTAAAFGDQIIARWASAAQASGAKDAKADATAVTVGAQAAALLDHEKRLTKQETKLDAIESTVNKFDWKLDELLKSRPAGK